MEYVDCVKINNINKKEKLKKETKKMLVGAFSPAHSSMLCGSPLAGLFHDPEAIFITILPNISLL